MRATARPAEIEMHSVRFLSGTEGARPHHHSRDRVELQRAVPAGVRLLRVSDSTPASHDREEPERRDDDRRDPWEEIVLLARDARRGPER